MGLDYVYKYLKVVNESVHNIFNKVYKMIYFN